MSNLSFGSGGFDCSSSKAHLPHVGLLSQPGTRPGIRPVIRGDRRRGRSSSRVFLSPFGHRHSLLGHPVPPGASAPLTVGLPRHHRHHGPERGFHVPHARDPAGIGRPLQLRGLYVSVWLMWCAGHAVWRVPGGQRRWPTAANEVLPPAVRASWDGRSRSGRTAWSTRRFSPTPR